MRQILLFQSNSKIPLFSVIKYPGVGSPRIPTPSYNLTGITSGFLKHSIFQSIYLHRNRNKYSFNIPCRSSSSLVFLGGGGERCSRRIMTLNFFPEYLEQKDLNALGSKDKHCRTLTNLHARQLTQNSTKPKPLKTQDLRNLKPQPR